MDSSDSDNEIDSEIEKIMTDLETQLEAICPSNSDADRQSGAILMDQYSEPNLPATRAFEKIKQLLLENPRLREDNNTYMIILRGINQHMEDAFDGMEQPEHVKAFLAEINSNDFLNSRSQKPRLG